MQRQLYNDKAHKALDIFRFAIVKPLKYETEIFETVFGV